MAKSFPSIKAPDPNRPEIGMFGVELCISPTSRFRTLLQALSDEFEALEQQVVAADVADARREATDNIVPGERDPPSEKWPFWDGGGAGTSQFTSIYDFYEACEENDSVFGDAESDSDDPDMFDEEKTRALLKTGITLHIGDEPPASEKTRGRSTRRHTYKPTDVKNHKTQEAAQAYLLKNIFAAWKVYKRPNPRFLKRPDLFVEQDRTDVVTRSEFFSSMSFLKSTKDAEWFERMVHYDEWHAWFRRGLKRIKSKFHASLNCGKAMHRCEKCYKHSVIHPESPHMVAWDALSCLCLVYDLVIISLRVFPIPESVVLDVLAWFTLIFWTVDCITRFFVAYYDKGILIGHPKSVAKHYFKTWFGIDISVVSIDWAMIIASAVSGSSGSGAGGQRVLKSLKLLRLARTLRVLKVLTVAKNVKALTENLDVHTQILPLLFHFLCPIGGWILVAHTLACVWYAIGSSNRGNSFIDVAELDSKSFGFQYATCLHWSLCQFSASSTDVYAVSGPERLYTIFATITGFILSTGVVGCTCAFAMEVVLGQVSNSRREMRQLTSYLSSHNISKRLSVQISRYCSYQRAHRPVVCDESEVVLLRLLSKELEAQLRLEIVKPHLSSHTLFRVLLSFHDSAIKSICAMALEPLVCIEPQTIFSAGDPCSKMYFIVTGTCQFERCAEGFESETIRLHRRNWVSEAVLWTPWEHAGYLTTSRDELRLLTCEEKAFNHYMSGAGESCLECAKTYAVSFVALLNESFESGTGLTDVPQQDFTPNMILEQNGFDIGSRLGRELPPGKRHFFISYFAGESDGVYNSLMAILEVHGMLVFNAKRDLAGEDVNLDVMQNHVRESVVLLSIISPKYFASKWCRGEAQAAHDSGIVIVPVYAGELYSLREIKDLMSQDGPEEKKCAKAVFKQNLIDVYNPTAQEIVQADIKTKIVERFFGVSDGHD